MKQTIKLVRPVTEAEAAQAADTGRMRIQIINPGWGSSGYYSRDVLEAAATAQVFAAGTQMYLDHPSYSERSDRPERSVRDLAGVLLEAGRWDDELGALVADTQVFGPYRDVLAEMREAIGVSIRASAVVEQGEAEGRTGTIVSELVEASSVDFVTQAGRGGRILSVLESARPAVVNERAVEHGVVEATANDTREALQTVLRDRFAGDQTWLWVRDFDETNVWYELETPDSSGCYQLPYTLTDGGQAVVDGDPIEVTARTQYVPVSPAGQSTTTQESQEDTMPQIEEARLRQLEADAGRVQTAEEARVAAEQRAQVAERALAEARTRATARPVAAEVVNASESLPASTKARLVEAAVVSIQLDDDGKYDETAFRAAVEASRTSAEAEVAEALQAAGVGSVRGAGHTTSSATGEVTESDVDREIASIFGLPVKEA